MNILLKLITIAVFTSTLLSGCSILPPVDKPFVIGEKTQRAEMAGAEDLADPVRQINNKTNVLAKSDTTPPSVTTESDTVGKRGGSQATTDERMVKLRESYTVNEGDLLWSISKRPDIYGDPLLWPLIYQANRDQITDPRKIYAGQTLAIPRNHSEDEREEARNLAKKSVFFSHE